MWVVMVSSFAVYNGTLYRCGCKNMIEMDVMANE